MFDMKDLARGKVVFINNRKGGATNDIFYPFCFAKSMYKSGFAGTHASMKSDHFFCADRLPKTIGRLLYIS